LRSWAEAEEPEKMVNEKNRIGKSLCIEMVEFNWFGRQK
jgi:hypothetical protein